MIDSDLDTRLSVMEKKIDDMHEVLMRMRHAQVAARNRKILYWMIIIVLTIISFYAIKPYLEQLKGIYGSTPASGSDYSELIKSLNQ